jgi:cytochrome c
LIGRGRLHPAQQALAIGHVEISITIVTHHHIVPLTRIDSVHPDSSHDHVVASPTEQDAAAGAPAQQEPIEKLLASATVEKGEAAAKKCAACHTFGKGEPNRVGPNLWGVVGRQKASEAGFNYSAAMKAQKGNWTPEDLDVYLTNPKAMVPGTNMTFAGIPRGKERADVITYLNSKSDKPVELPKQAAAAAPAPTAAAAPAAPKPH